jgi:hypothetical protein
MEGRNEEQYNLYVLKEHRRTKGEVNVININQPQKLPH